ncbi:MFS transporter [Desulfoprunum benzoelyticum]|uniref:NNP family nitrate/nitrite transporter-like MFS transporter n=1 Tax=Desulfoprunum benzoelyticum TaxID=1506996 RepID=A0A840USL4_9BACT|nr:MFS transporter [Desulfoprunum benzoelyticum]MBB5348782.1 NNP family nitrate/nitrite transporter-like MFS transporter [Desulfoprunum benzoelyticum]MBM9529945.1 MFS transporter [Desulfoprunum benzoelyticum]
MTIGTQATENGGYLPFRRVLPQILFLSSLFLLNFLSRIIFSPLLPQIERELGFGHTVSGSFFLWISAGYFPSVLFSGFVSARITFKRTIVLSTLAAGSALVILSHCETMNGIRAALFGLGLASGLYLPAALSTITRMVAPSFWGRGIAVHELAPNIGFIIAPLICGVMVEWSTWRHGLEVIGFCLIVMAVLYGLKGRGGKDRGVPLDPAVFRVFLAMPQFWLMILLFSLAICSTMGVYAMLPLLLVTGQGIDADSANRLLSLSRFCTIIMPLPAGWLGDRYGNRQMMVAALLLAGLLTIPIGLLSGVPLLAAVFLQPMVAVCFFPSAFAVLSTLGGRKLGAAAVSLCIPMAFLIGGGVMPTLIGGIGDRFNLGAGFVFAGLAMTTAAVLAAIILRLEVARTMECKEPTNREDTGA